LSKNNSEHIWIEVGNNQFAAEGLEGIQVERLARIAGLNKSGYYHYFGDRDSFLEKLMEHHLQLAIPYANELKQVQQFDPEFINLLIKHSTSVMFDSQLVRNRHVKLIEETHAQTRKIVDPILSKLFAEFIGHKDHLEFAVKYYNQVWFMFHGQITFKKMNHPFLRDFMYNAREVIQQAIELATNGKPA
jgi:AcrR family transcriptional regulator